MAETPADPRKEKIEWAPRYWLGWLVVMVLALFVAWRLGFIYGNRAVDDLLLPPTDANTEIIELRVQLQEARTFQDTLLTTLLAAFAAGFSILVLVNIGLVVFAQRSFDRDERYMRAILTAGTRDLIVGEERRSTAALNAESQRLESRFNNQLAQFSDAYSATASVIQRLQIETLSLQAMVAERSGNFSSAAVLWSQLLPIHIAQSNFGRIQPVLDQIRDDLDSHLSYELKPHTMLSESDQNALRERLEDVRNTRAAMYGDMDLLVNHIQALLDQVIERQDAPDRS